MASAIIIDGLSFYETRAMLMFIEVKNRRIGAEAIRITDVKETPGGIFSLSLRAPDTLNRDIFAKELSEVRSNGYSMVDPSWVDQEKLVGVIFSHTRQALGCHA